LMVFVLIMATNLLDRNNFLRVRDSIVTIYEDRLVAKDIIFDMSKAVQTKRLAVITTDSIFFQGRNQGVNAELDNMVERFEQTKLTVAEQRTLDKFKNDLSELQAAESMGSLTNETSSAMLLDQLNGLDQTLDQLSDIQMQEGQRQMKIGKSAVSAVELFTQMELYLLVALAIVIQIIILYNPSKKEAEQ